MLRNLGFSALQKGLLLFWSIWLTLVAATNLFDAAKQMGLLPDGWTFASYNFDLVVGTLGVHGIPPVVAAVLFAVIIVWEMLAAGLFWIAYGSMLRGAPGTTAEVTRAFVVSLALWAAFLIATEATVSYVTAATHKGTLIAQLASLLVIRAGGTSADIEEPASEATAAKRPVGTS
jgi:hypothetical protein